MRLAGRRSAAAGVQRADDARARAGPGAEGQDEVADPKLGVGGDVGRRRAAGLGAQHRDVEAGVAPGHLGRERAPVRAGERHLAGPARRCGSP